MLFRSRIYFDLVASVNAFIGAIVICTTPWMIIMTIGYVTRRGCYFPDDVQVFNRLPCTYYFTQNAGKIRSEGIELETAFKVTRQATMIAYLDDFKAIMILTLALIPMVLLLCPPKTRAGEAAPAVLD